MKSNLCVSGAREVDPVIVRQEPAWQISIFVPNSVLYLTFEWYQSNSPPESKYFSNLLQFTVSYYNKSTVSFSQTSRHHTTVFTACVVILFTSINSKHSETWEASGRLAKKKKKACDLPSRTWDSIDKRLDMSQKHNVYLRALWS